MKRFHLPLFLLLTLVFSACGSKTAPSPDATNGDSLTHSVAAPQDDRDSQRELRATPEYQGKKYAIDIHSAPDASLPKVKDSYGDDYLDNRCRVRISREGEDLGLYAFTKADFRHLLTPSDGQNLILGGIAFKEIRQGCVCLGAQLNAPGNEEGGIAFEIKIPLGGEGQPLIERDTRPDIENIHEEEVYD